MPRLATCQKFLVIKSGKMGWPATLAGWLFVCLAAASWRLVVSFPHGLEGSDEGSYLLFAANPWASPGLGLFYGFLLHPLWQMAGASVAGYRLAGWMVLGLVVVGFSGCLWRLLRQWISPVWIGALFFSLSLAGFAHYTRGIRTPGYDWAVLVGALVFCSGWLWLETEKTGRAWIVGESLMAGGLLVLAAGKWLVLPGFLVLLGLLLWIRPSAGGVGKSWIRLAGWFFLFALGFVFYAGFPGLIDTWKAGLIYGRSSDRDGIFLAYLGWILGYGWVLLRALIWVAALYFIVWATLKFIWRKNPSPVWLGSTIFVLALGLALARGHGQGGLQSWGKASMLVGTWLIGVLLLTRTVTGLPKNVQAIVSSPVCRVIFLLSVVPLLNAAGTITGLTNYLAHGSVFFVAAGWVALARAFSLGLPAYGLFAAFFMLGTVQAARIYTTPDDIMRIGRVWEANTPVQNGPEAGKLYLHESSVRALTVIDGAMRDAGFRAGDPVAGWWDLCGLVYLLGGTSPGSSWYLGGMPAHFQNISPEVIVRTWVLFRLGVSEEPADFWPKAPGLSPPVPIHQTLVWPAGDGEGNLEPVRLYRPAVPSRGE